MALLNVTNLKCVRGEQSLFENLSFSLASQQCLHIKGMNGSGKTSLLRVLAGLLSYDEGHIEWQEKNPPAYLGHKDGLKNEFSAIENLRFYLYLRDTPTSDKQRDEDQLDHALNQLGILKQADTPTKSLSFGQRRRLAFARLVFAQEKVWILDEPLTGVDMHGRKLIENQCLKHLSKGGAIIMSHHGDLTHSDLAPQLKSMDLSK